jgi:hypothetical protein
VGQRHRTQRPSRNRGTGTHWEGGLYDTVKDYDLTYRYANGVVMTCQPGNPSIKFIGSDGWVGNTGWRGPLEASSPAILNAVIGPNEIKLRTNPEGEHRDFLDCVKTRQDPYFPVDIGHRVSTVCHLGNIAIKLGRKLKWDPVAECFENDPSADAMRSRPMREPWTLGCRPRKPTGVKVWRPRSSSSCSRRILRDTVRDEFENATRRLGWLVQPAKSAGPFNPAVSPGYCDTG